MDIGAERVNDGFNQNVYMFAFVCFVTDNVSGKPGISLLIFSFLSSCIFTNTKLEDFLKFSGLSVLFLPLKTFC